MHRQGNQSYKTDTGLQTRYDNDKLPFPNFQKPTAVGYFSVSTDRDYEPNDQNLRYYKPPKTFPLDLNAGIQLAIKKAEGLADYERIDNLLLFIFDNKHKLLKPLVKQSSSEMLMIDTEFVCWRGLLRLLMCTPYEFREDWCIHITKYRGTFYMCKLDTDQEKFKRATETENQKKMSSWGFKFEQYCLSESPFKNPETSVPVDECSEFSCVFKTRIGGIEVLYGAEMDGIISEQPVQLDKNNILRDLKFVELKVRQNNLNSAQLQSYKRYKTRNWWCQSFLVGIEDIYVGLRTEAGLVQKIDRVEVRSLKGEGANYWSPNICTNFLIQFFTVVKKIMAAEDCPYTTYEFYFNANTSRITYECFKGKTKYSFLPDWYLAMFQLSKPNTKPNVVVNSEQAP